MATEKKNKSYEEQVALKKNRIDQKLSRISKNYSNKKKRLNTTFNHDSLRQSRKIDNKMIDWDDFSSLSYKLSINHESQEII